MDNLYFQIYFSFEKLCTSPASPVYCCNYEKDENILSLFILNTELNKENLPALFTISLKYYCLDSRNREQKSILFLIKMQRL